MESRGGADRETERLRGAAVATAVALALLLALGGAGVGAGDGAVPADAGPADATAGGGPSNALAVGDRSAAFETVTSPRTQTDGPPVGEAFQEEIDPDSVRLTVSVAADGTARWRLEYWTELNDENETVAFEELQADVEANRDEYAARFANRTSRTVAAAENATGREMRADEFGVGAETRTIPQEYGVLTYTFAWRGFAVADGDRLEVGDAIEGFYLNDRTRLVVEWPGEYALVEATPDPDERRDRAVLWRGTQTDFVSNEPRVIVESGGSGGGGGDGANGDGTAGGGDGPPLVWVGGALALLALAGGGLAVLRRNGGAGRGGDERTTPSTNPEAQSGDVAATDAAERNADAQAGAGERDADARTDAGERGGDGQDAGERDDPPAELLSNEEQVRRALAANGGRMRQQELVAETGWTEAKTSQVVGELRDAGAVETFRLGRENVLKLPDGEDDE